MRGIRGAITVGRNEKEEIWQAAQELVTEILRTNNITPADIGAAIFSV
ncbi:MAG: chorismate mutase, partial [Selenomonas sp.]|nr:chorismate mutase [Selenomonas sp.]